MNKKRHKKPWITFKIKFTKRQNQKRRIKKLFIKKAVQE